MSLIIYKKNFFDDFLNVFLIVKIIFDILKLFFEIIQVRLVLLLLIIDDFNSMQTVKLS